MQPPLPDETAHPIRGLFAQPWRWLMYASGGALRKAHAIGLPRILMYHEVASGHLSPARFTWQLRYLRAHFEPVSLGELVHRVTNGTIRGREIALTFDDGLHNHYEVVWPLLREHGIPATFFVCPGLADTGAWLWRVELRQRLKSLPRTERERVARESGCDADSTHAIMDWTKSLPAAECDAFRARVAAVTHGFTPSAEQRALFAPLTWNEMRALDPALITIGSHTRTHPLLPTLTDAQLRDEIVGSRAALEAGLGRPVEFFCYPNGIVTAASVELVRAHYRAGVSIYNGFVQRDDDPALLPRIPSDGSRATFVRRLHRPGA